MEFVELDAARASTDIRLVVAARVPSPWSEAAKGLLRVAGLPAVVVRQGGDAAITAWSGADNVPALLHANEPVRTSWSAIVALVARLTPGILPTNIHTRAQVMGAIDVLAGEDGLGWNARLVMIHVGLTSDGKRGFAPRTAAYLAKRYGYDAQKMDDAAGRIPAQLEHVRALLTADYFGGSTPNALDVYTATFLTMLTPLSEADCPGCTPALRAAFGTAAEELGALVPASLAALRARMFERHLAWPIAL